MANPIFHSQYTAAQIEDLIENGAPIIQNGYWWRWDVATQQYVNTNITADSETAAQAAEAAQAAAEDARDDAQDAQTAAETAQGLAEDARDAAAASAASIAASAAQIDANTARIDYVALREEEDRQILFGSIVEAATDEYSELRSAPIHNAISIGGSVYPRMDRTRMAIDRLYGRTVAFNQLVQDGNFASASNWGFNRCTGVVSGNKMTITMAANVASSANLYQTGVSSAADHKYYVSVFVTSSKDTQMQISFGGSNLLTKTVVANTRTQLTTVNRSSGLNNYLYLYPNNNGALSEGDTVVVEYFMLIDLTADYGTTLADSIYAMEQAAAGAGVAYVRQRMDLDYYASNAGELKAPVVSGVSFVGFNNWDEEWELGYYYTSSGQFAYRNNGICSKHDHPIPVIGGATYYLNVPDVIAQVFSWIGFYDANDNYIGSVNVLREAFAVPQNAMYMRFYVHSNYGLTYNHDICINVSKTTGTPKNGDYLPYISTSLSLPSTRLDGVGTAQDVLFVREDGENDYSLIKTAKMGLVDLGTLNYTKASATAEGKNYFFTGDIRNEIKHPASYSDICNNIAAGYVTASGANVAAGSVDKAIGEDAGGYVSFIDSAYNDVDAAAFKTAMSGKYLAYELATPVETVIASHLTLAEVSAIAENGGIISVENSNGHIVQPDFVADVVISRSAS